MSTDRKFSTRAEHRRTTSLLLLSVTLAITLFVGLRQTMASAQEPAAIICVKPGGGGGCFDSINGAMAAASAGDVIRVAAGERGGGLRNHQDTEATFANVTLADNEATEGGGIYNDATPSSSTPSSSATWAATVKRSWPWKAVATTWRTTQVAASTRSRAT